MLHEFTFCLVLGPILNGILYRNIGNSRYQARLFYIPSLGEVRAAPGQWQRCPLLFDEDMQHTGLEFAE